MPDPGTEPVARPTFLAECLWPGVTLAEHASAAARARAAAEAMAAEGIAYLGSLVVPEDEVVLFQFSGPSVELIRAVAERAALPFERIVESMRTP